MRWRLLVVPTGRGHVPARRVRRRLGLELRRAALNRRRGRRGHDRASDRRAYSGGYAIPPDVSDQAAAAAGSSEAGTVVAKDIAYNPTEITVKVGDTVTFKNEDGFAHTFTADNGEFDSNNVDGGGQFQFAPDAEGTIAFHCKIHSNMKGTITVEA